MAEAGSANIQGLLHVDAPLGSRRKKKIKKTVGTLYVNRPVLNAAEIIAWAKANGFEKTVTPDDMHVTIAFSRKPIEWPDPRPELKTTFMPANPSVELFGKEHDCAVLKFESQQLFNRWKQFCDLGASWDWPNYAPHITISYDAAGVDVDAIEPYSGKIVLGPEEFSEVNDDWKAGVVEKIGWTDEARAASLAARQAAATADKHTQYIKDYLKNVASHSTVDRFILDNGRAYRIGPDTFNGARDQPNLCFMNAGRIALSNPNRTYVEGYLTVHGVPLKHAWTVDKQGKVYDSTITGPEHLGATYFGVPFTTDYVAKTALKTKVWGILSHTNKDLFKEGASLKGVIAKRDLWFGEQSLFQKFDPSQPRDEHGRWTDSGSSTPAQDLLKKHRNENDTMEDVNKRLTPAQRYEMTKAEEDLKGETPTNVKFMGPDGKYLPDRQALHEKILNEMFNKEDVQNATPKPGEQPTLILTGGRPAAGKTSAIKGTVDTKGSFYISADTIQEHLPGYTRAKAGLYNGEAQDIALQAEKIARDNKLNITYDATLKSQQPAHERVDTYKADGYKVNGYFVHTTPTESAVRSVQRYMDTGRYVPPSVSFNSLTNEKTFDSLIPKLDNWAVFDNNGTKPIKVASGGIKLG